MESDVELEVTKGGICSCNSFSVCVYAVPFFYFCMDWSNGIAIATIMCIVFFLVKMLLTML